MQGARRDGYATTSERGLDFTGVPMRLFQKAKKLGTWDPAEISFAQDAADWEAAGANRQNMVLRLISLFQGGEEAVTVDLLPLLMTVAREGRIEDEIYLTSFLWEEAKHVEFFRRWLDEVVGHPDLGHLLGSSWRALFLRELPDSMNALLDDPTPAAQVRASVTYNMVVEGVLAETGYYGIGQVLERQGLMPGLVAGMKLLQRDESRHIRFGVYLLERLVAADPSLWAVMEERMSELFPLAMGVIQEYLDAEDLTDGGALDIDPQEFITYAGTQFDKRMRVLERSRSGGVSSDLDE